MRRSPQQVLMARYPEHREVLKAIVMVREAAKRKKYEAVVDDGLLLSEEADPRKVTAKVTPAALRMWTTHMALGCQTRMHALEDAVLRELATRGFLSSLILVRAHVETAGLAAACLNLLEDFHTAATFKKLEKFIAQTLMGNSLRRKASSNTIAAGAIHEFQPDTISATECANALDVLARRLGDRHEGRRVFNYSWLCNFSHPNSQSLCCFKYRYLDDGAAVAEYHPELKHFPDTSMQSLVMMYDAMRLGYTSCVALERAEFREESSSVVVGLPLEADIRSFFNQMPAWHFGHPTDTR